MPNVGFWFWFAYFQAEGTTYPNNRRSPYGTWERIMSAKFKAVLGLMALSAATAVAALPATEAPAPMGSDVIYACYANSDGSLRILPPGMTCKKQETAISWNRAGPVGPVAPLKMQGPAHGRGSGGWHQTKVSTR